MSYTPDFDYKIKINKKEQLSGTLRSDVLYVIDGTIDMGDVSIKVPEGGLAMRGHGYFVSALYSSTDNHKMFITDPVGTYAGNLRVREVSLYTTGTGAKMFELDNAENNGAVEFNSVNIGDFAGVTTSLGNLDDYRQFRTYDCGIININDGLEFNGTWAGGCAIEDTICLRIQAGVTVFKEGTSLVFNGSTISNINAATASGFTAVDPTVVVFQWSDSNFSRDQGFSLQGARFIIDGNAVPNVDINSTKILFKDCSGVQNTFAGGKIRISSEVLTPLTLNTPTKVLGTTTSSNVVYFTQTANNELTYNSTINKEFNVECSAVVQGGANDEIKLILRKWDNSASAYVDIDENTQTINNVLGGLDVANFSIKDIVTLDELDRIELWMENTTDSTDATVINNSYIILSARV